MQRNTPPFRADHVGSLLRPAPLKEARAGHAKGEITDAQLAEVENREIGKIIRKQEEVGLKLATDGEFRRSWWQFDFYKGLDGVELYTVGEGIQFAGVVTKAESVRVTGKIGFTSHPHVDHFKFLKAHTKVTPKMTIPAPSTLHFRQGRPSIVSRLGLTRWTSAPCSSAQASSLRVMAAFGRRGLSEAPMRATEPGEKNPGRRPGRGTRGRRQARRSPTVES